MSRTAGILACPSCRAAAIAALAPPTLILDGEVVVFDAQLISRFEWLRRRDPEVVGTPPIYMVFDLLRTGPPTSVASPCARAAPRWSDS